VCNIESRLLGNGKCCGRIVTGDHDHPDAGILALLYGLWNIWPEWIGEAGYADKFKLKIVLRGGPLIPPKLGLCNTQNTHPL